MKMGQEELEVEANLGYIISSRSGWAIQLHSITKLKKKKGTEIKTWFLFHFQKYVNMVI